MGFSPIIYPSFLSSFRMENNREEPYFGGVSTQPPDQVRNVSDVGRSILLIYPSTHGTTCPPRHALEGTCVYASSAWIEVFNRDGDAVAVSALTGM
jgi:hypothetical protein